MSKKYGIVELFAGISGLAQGFVETNRFKILGLLDIDKNAKESFQLNYPKTNYIQGNIRSIAPKEFIKRIGGEKPFAILGCPPCQGLSAAGRRDKRDSRNKLIYNYFNYIEVIKPKMFILENVPQVLEVSNYKKLICDFAESEGFNIWSGVLNCALYGLPQTRQRAVVIGYHKSLKKKPTPPQPTHYGKRTIFSYSKQKKTSTAMMSTYESALGWYSNISNNHKIKEKDKMDYLLSLKPLITVKDALGDLPKASTVGEENSEVAYIKKPSNEYQRIMRDGCEVLTAHKEWGHGREMRMRMESVSEGSVQFRDKENGRSGRYFSQAYGRLHSHGLARTITGNFHNPGCGRYIHYCENRTLTVREASRLQGFEDKFVFGGNLMDQRRIIGNAFPKTLAKVIAAHVIKELF